MRRGGGISFHSSGFTDYGIEQTTEILREIGYQAIELNMETAAHFQPHILPDLAQSKREEIRQTLRSAGLSLSSLSAHVSLIEPDEYRREVNCNFVKGAVDLAVDLGTDVVHVFSGIVPDGVSESHCWLWLVEELCECLDYTPARREGRHGGRRLSRFFSLEPFDDLQVD